MTTATQVPAAAKPQVKRDRRWKRVVIPFAVLIALITGTLIVHAIETPDQDDSDYLSPVSQADIGSAVLAGRLRDQGVTVVRETSTTAALSAMTGGDATLFVTTPDLADIEQLSAPGAVPPGTRMVVVTPDDAAFVQTTWAVGVARERWAPGLVDPDCADPIAHAAGQADVGKLWYAPTGTTSCYGGAVHTIFSNGATVTLVGAPDPFRNDRIANHGNLRLAVGLLSQTSRVVWLDVHQREVRPKPSPSPSSASPKPRESRASASASPDESFTDEPTDDAPPQEQPQSASAPNPLWDAFPPAVWASIVLLALALLAFAIAAARRLGTPVAEPLPSRVPSNETMLGHARLYQRAHARDESLDILRDAARRRIVAHLGLAPTATLEEIADAAGYDAEDLREILASFHPENDAELVSAANAVQKLVREITGFEGEQS